MVRIGKIVALLLTLTIVMPSLILLTIKPANAQTIPKPSVPEFTLRFIDSSYDIPATTSKDPFNGQQIITPSRHVEQWSIEIRIKNVDFIPIKIQDSNNNTIDAVFCYVIQWKPRFSDNGWFTLFEAFYSYLPQSSGAETIRRINMTMPTNNEQFDVSEWSRYIPTDSQLNFRVKAMIGGPNDVYNFKGEESDWSNTQTLNLADGSVSLSTPNPSPTVPELSWLIIVPLLLSVFSVAIIVRYRKTAI